MTDDEILSANEREIIARARAFADELLDPELGDDAEIVLDLIALTERLATDAARLSAERGRREK